MKLRAIAALALVTGVTVVGCSKTGGTASQPPVTVTATVPTTVVQTTAKTVPTTATATKTVPTTATKTVTKTVTETPAAPTSVTIYGAMTLTGRDNWDKVGSGCAGNGGYDDLKADTTVTISAGDGDVLALEALDAGRIDGTDCIFNFTAENVPGGERLYLVEVSHRGKLEAHDQGSGQYIYAGTIGD